MKTGLLNKTALCAAGIAVGMAAPVWADPEQDTIIFGGSGAGTIPYTGFGEPVPLDLGTLGVDIVNIFTQSQGGDALEDLRFVTGLGLSEEAFGRIELAGQGLLGELPPAPIEADVAAFEDVPHFGGFGGSINQRGRFAADELGAPRFFETGDTVGADDFPGLIWPVDVATDRFIDGLEAGPLDAIDLFGTEGGALPNQGDTGIFGFVIEFYESSPLYEFPINQVAAFEEENGPPDLCLIPIDLEQFEPATAMETSFVTFSRKSCWRAIMAGCRSPMAPLCLD
jgi:hypothetical protein